MILFKNQLKSGRNSKFFKNYKNDEIGENEREPEMAIVVARGGFENYFPHLLIIKSRQTTAFPVFTIVIVFVPVAVGGQAVTIKEK